LTSARTRYSVRPAASSAKPMKAGPLQTMVSRTARYLVRHGLHGRQQIVRTSRDEGLGALRQWRWWTPAPFECHLGSRAGVCHEPPHDIHIIPSEVRAEAIDFRCERYCDGLRATAVSEMRQNLFRGSRRFVREPPVLPRRWQRRCVGCAVRLACVSVARSDRARLWPTFTALELCLPGRAIDFEQQQTEDGKDLHIGTWRHCAGRGGFRCTLESF
jgi:hypothetical protein